MPEVCGACCVQVWALQRRRRLQGSRRCRLPLPQRPRPLPDRAQLPPSAFQQARRLPRPRQHLLLLPARHPVQV